MELGWGLSQSVVPVVVYILCMGAAVLTLFWRIEVGLAVFLFFMPLQNILEYAIDFPLGKDLNDILLISMLIRWILNSGKSEYSLFSKSPLNLPIFLLMLWTFFELFRGAEYVGFTGVLSLSNPLFISFKNYLISPIIFFIIVNNVRDKRTITFLVVVMLMAVLVLDHNFYNIIRYRDNSHYSSEMIVMGTGMALSGNWLAVFLAQSTAVIMALFLTDKHKYRRLLYSVTIIASLYCIMFLFSRSGYVAVVASILVLATFKNRLLFVGAILLVLFYNVLVPQAVVERIEMTKTEEGFDDTTRERLEMWEQAKQMVSEEPLMGWGFDITSQITVRAESFQNYTWNSFHNNYLQTLVEIGAVGLSLTLMIFFMAFSVGFRLFRRTDLEPFYQGLGLGVMACVAAVLAGNIAGSYWQFFNVGGNLWAFTGLANAMLLIKSPPNPVDHQISKTKRNRIPGTSRHRYSHHNRPQLETTFQEFAALKQSYTEKVKENTWNAL